MEDLTLWLSFIGAWLLFAGSIYQAALELQDQDIETERIRSLGAHITPPPKISPWWWLVPPVKLWLERQRSRTYRLAYFAAMEQEDMEALIAFMNKAFAWMLVALGGVFLASNETYHLSQRYSLPTYACWLIIAGLIFLSTLHVIFRTLRTSRLLKNSKS